MSQPLVSVIIPVFNCEKYVFDTIISVIEQDYLNIELIVVDDGSTDKSISEIKRALSYKEFTLITQSNVGLVATLKNIRQVAKGKYLSILGCDDLWEKSRIRKLVEQAEKKQLAMVFSNCKYINNRGKEIGFSNIKFNESLTFKYLLRGSLSIPSPSVMVVREVYNSIDYPSDYIEDFPMWLAISKENRVGFLSEKLCSYRIHPESMSNQYERMMLEEKKIIQQYQNEVDYHTISIFWQLRWIKCKLKYLDFFDRNSFFSVLKFIKVYFKRDFYVIVLYLMKRSVL